MKKRFGKEKKKHTEAPKRYSDDISGMFETLISLAEKGERLQKFMPSGEKAQKVFSLVVGLLDRSKEKEGHSPKERMKKALRDPAVLREMGSLIRKGSDISEGEAQSRYKQVKQFYKAFGLDDTIEQYKGHWLQPKGQEVIEETHTQLALGQSGNKKLPKIIGADGRKRVDMAEVLYQYKDPGRKGHLNTSKEMFIRKRDLSGVTFEGTKRHPYVFAGVSLHDVTFDYATFDHCSFKDADLSHSSFRDVFIKGPVDFEGAVLDRKGAETLLPAIRNAQEQGIDITLNAKFIGDFTGLDFSGINVSGADFTAARIDGANFRNTIIDGADIAPEQLARAMNIAFINNDTINFGDALGVSHALDLQYQTFSEAIASRAISKAQQKAVEDFTIATYYWDTGIPAPEGRERIHLPPETHRELAGKLGASIKEAIGNVAKTPQETELIYATLMTDQALPVGEGGVYVKFSEMLAENLMNIEALDITQTKKGQKTQVALGDVEPAILKQTVATTCISFLRDFDRMTRFNPLAHPPAMGALTPHDIVGEGGVILPKGSIYVVPPEGIPTLWQFLKSDVAAVMGNIMAGAAAYLPKAAVKATEAFQEWLDPSGRKIQSSEERTAHVNAFITDAIERLQGGMDESYGKESTGYTSEKEKLAKKLTEQVLEKCADLPSIPERLEENMKAFEKVANILAEYALVQDSGKEAAVPKIKNKDTPWLERAADAIAQVIRENSKGIYQEKILAERSQAPSATRGV